MADVIYLGTGTSFNIKTAYPDIDYTDLTVNNFFAEAQDMYAGGKESSTLAMYTRQQTYYTAPKKSYNATTGILTVSAAESKATTTNDKSFSASTTASARVYMVV